MTTTTLSKRIFLKAPRETVWAFLTQPDKLAQWFHAPKEPLKEGATLELFGAESGDLLVSGEVRAARAPEYLEYSFSIKPMGGAESTVKWTLTEVAGGTQLDMSHEGLPQGEAAFDLTLALDDGWDKHFAQMRDALKAIA